MGFCFSYPHVSRQYLSVDGDGFVVYELKYTISDGTTHLVFEPQDFIARLAYLVPHRDTTWLYRATIKEKFQNNSIFARF